MKQLTGLVVVLLLSAAAIGVFMLGSTMMEQEAEDALLLYAGYEEDNESLAIYVLNASTGEERL